MSAIKIANKILLDIDDSKEIASFKLNDGFILWLQVRYRVFKILENSFEKDSINIPNAVLHGRRFYKLCEKLKYYFNLLKFNPLLRKNEYEGVVFSTTMGTFKSDDLKFTNKTNYFFGKHKSWLMFTMEYLVSII